MITYFVSLALLAVIYGIAAIGLNILVGSAGIFSLAHAVFFGVGAYAAALMAIHVTPDILVCCGAAIGVTAVLSLCLAFPALRVRGEYFVVASLGLQMVAATVFNEAQGVTGGYGGLAGIPAPTIFGTFSLGTPTRLLLTSLGILLLGLGVVLAFMRHSFGRALGAIRDSEIAARAIGKNVELLKTTAVVLGCTYAGVAGALFAFDIAFINPESFTLDQSGLILTMVVLGGAGTLLGPLVGAVILTLLPALLTFLPMVPPTEIGTLQQFIYGLTMVLLMIFRPAGLVGRRSARR